MFCPVQSHRLDEFRCQKNYSSKLGSDVKDYLSKVKVKIYEAVKLVGDKEEKYKDKMSAKELIEETIGTNTNFSNWGKKKSCDCNPQCSCDTYEPCNHCHCVSEECSCVKHCRCDRQCSCHDHTRCDCVLLDHM